MRNVTRALLFGAVVGAAFGLPRFDPKAAFPRPTGANLFALAWHQDAFIAVGSNGDILRLSSGDPAQAAVSASFGGVNFVGVASDGALCVAASLLGEVYTSADGRSWRQAASVPEAQLAGIVAGHLGFVAFGTNGSVLVSDDGQEWRLRATGYAETFRAGCIAGGYYVLVGERGICVRSRDLVTWEKLPAPTAETLRAVAFGSGQLVVAGDDSSLHVTKNFGAQWARHGDLDGARVNGLAFGSMGFVAVTENGRVWQTWNGEEIKAASAASSDPLYSAAALGANRFVAVGRRGFLVHSGFGATAGDGKLSGDAAEVGSDIRHPNGNVYDQVLLRGRAAAMTADAGQVLRASFIDVNDDIVQVEFSGAGTLVIYLEGLSGPDRPVKYNQQVDYVRGHAHLTLLDSDETTNVSFFSVGRATAVNAALFRAGESYDGWADLASLTVRSRNGRAGGIRFANAEFSNNQSVVGIVATGVAFQGPVFFGDVVSSGTASAALIFGRTTDVRITGGSLAQSSGASVDVSGLERLVSTAGSDSHGTLVPAAAVRGRLTKRGADVTSQVAGGGG